MSEIAIDLYGNLFLEKVAQIKEFLPDSYEIIEMPFPWSHQLAIKIRYAGRAQFELTCHVGMVVEEFLKGLSDIHHLLKNSSTRILLGLFHEVPRTAICSVDLSLSCIKLMSELDLALDTNVYLIPAASFSGGDGLKLET